jgi:hypothetical protein
LVLRTGRTTKQRSTDHDTDTHHRRSTFALDHRRRDPGDDTAGDPITGDRGTDADQGTRTDTAAALLASGPLGMDRHAGQPPTGLDPNDVFGLWRIRWLPAGRSQDAKTIATARVIC